MLWIKSHPVPKALPGLPVTSPAIFQTLGTLQPPLLFHFPPDTWLCLMGSVWIYFTCVLSPYPLECKLHEGKGFVGSVLGCVPSPWGEWGEWGNIEAARKRARMAVQRRCRGKFLQARPPPLWLGPYKVLWEAQRVRTFGCHSVMRAPPCQCRFGLLSLSPHCRVRPHQPQAGWPVLSAEPVCGGRPVLSDHHHQSEQGWWSCTDSLASGRVSPPFLWLACSQTGKPWLS